MLKLERETKWLPSAIAEKIEAVFDNLWTFKTLEDHKTLQSEGCMVFSPTRSSEII